MRYQFNGNVREGRSQSIMCLYEHFSWSFKDVFHQQFSSFCFCLEIPSKTALSNLLNGISFRQKNFRFYFKKILVAKNYDKISFCYHKEDFPKKKFQLKSKEGGRECECLQTLTSVRHFKFTKADKNFWWNSFCEN